MERYFLEPFPVVSNQEDMNTWFRGTTSIKGILRFRNRFTDFSSQIHGIFL